MNEPLSGVYVWMMKCWLREGVCVWSNVCHDVMNRLNVVVVGMIVSDQSTASDFIRCTYVYKLMPLRSFVLAGRGAGASIESVTEREPEQPQAADGRPGMKNAVANPLARRRPHHRAARERDEADQYRGRAAGLTAASPSLPQLA